MGFCWSGDTSFSPKNISSVTNIFIDLNLEFYSNCFLQDACIAVAALLQYIYLVVFFLMLAEGIEIAVTVLYVFSTKSRIKWLLPAAWGMIGFTFLTLFSQQKGVLAI